MKDDKLEQLANDLLELKQTVDRYNQRLSILREKIKKEMIKRKQKSVTYGSAKITLSTPETVVYDEGILQAVPPRVRKQIVSSHLDVQKLSQAVQQGLIEPELLKGHTHVVKKSPYITVTPK